METVRNIADKFYIYEEMLTTYFDPLTYDNKGLQRNSEFSTS